MTLLKAGNLAVKFALELVAVAAFAYWGATTGHGVVAAVLAIIAPLAAVMLWGRFAAPKSPTRLALRLRAPFELTVLALAALALLRLSTTAATAFAFVAVVNSLLLAALGQWDA